MGSGNKNGFPFDILSTVLNPQESARGCRCFKTAMIEITGEVKFRNHSAPESIPEGSHLIVSFQDVSLMDAPSVTIGEVEVDLVNYKKERALTYSIKCALPIAHSTGLQCFCCLECCLGTDNGLLDQGKGITSLIQRILSTSKMELISTELMSSWFNIIKDFGKCINS